jgi:hypothetical protein
MFPFLGAASAPWRGWRRVRLPPGSQRLAGTLDAMRTYHFRGRFGCGAIGAIGASGAFRAKVN